MEVVHTDPQPLRWATEQDWEDCEEVVRTSFTKHTLHEIMKMVEEKYRFRATLVPLLSLAVQTLYCSTS